MRFSFILQVISALSLFFHTAYAKPPVPLREGSPIYMEQTIETFPDIVFYDAEGRAHTLSDFNGTPRIVNFWATWCAPCVREMPHLRALATKYGNQLNIILINEDRAGFEAIAPFMQQHELSPLTSYHDKGNKEFRKLLMKGLPMSFLLDADGKHIATIQGEVDWLSDDIATLLGVKKPTANRD
jgi:thiol-disulfide isomerase/thioredoxin